MKRKILIVADRTPARWTRAAIEEPSETEWVVLPLGVMSDVYAQSNAAALAPIIALRYAQTQPYAEAAQDYLRNAVPALVEELARHGGLDGVPLRESLQLKEVNLWWSLELTEKSAFRGRWIQNLYYLCLVVLACQADSYDAVWLDTEDGGLAAAVQSWKQAPGSVYLIDPPVHKSSVDFYKAFFDRLGRTAVTTLLRHLVCRWRLPKNAKGEIKDSISFFSFYPYFWDKALTTDASDRFFGEIPERLRRQTPVSFFVWLDMTPSEIWRRARTLADVFKARNILPIQRPLSVGRLLSALRPGRVASLLRFYRRIRRLSSWDFNGFDIAVLLREELERDLCSREIWLGLLVHEGILALLDQEKPRCLLYRAEFQPYETLLAAACQGRIPTVGFQHAAIGRNHLGYRWTAGEWSARPGKPDFMICTGSYAAELFEKEGIGRDRIQICGPARYGAMFKYFDADRAELRRRCQIPENARVFFVAATVVWAEVRNILEMLQGAVRGTSAEQITFLFKCHPSADFSEKIREHITRHMPELSYRILPHGVPMYDFVAASDALLSAGSTLSLEALCLGVMPIVFEDTSRFSVNPMLEAREGVFAVQTSDELGRAIAAVAACGADLEAKRRQWPTIVRQYFLTLEGDPVERFLSCLAHWDFITSDRLPETASLEAALQ